MTTISLRDSLLGLLNRPDRDLLKKDKLREFLSLVDVNSEFATQVDSTGMGQFRKIQPALEYMAGKLSGSEKGIVSVAPGVYEENVVMPRNVGLVGAGGFGPSAFCSITSPSGDTMKVPGWDSLVYGMSVYTTSSTATDSAVRLYDDGDPAGFDGTFMVNFLMSGLNGARSYTGDPVSGAQVIAIYGGTDSFGAPPIGMFVEGSGLFWLLGGGGSDGAVGIHIENGGQVFIGAGVSIGADPAAGLVVECDGGFFAGLDVRIDDGHDGIKAVNGSTVFLGTAVGLGGLAGVPVETDAGSFLVTGNVQLEPLGGAPLANWNIAGPWIPMFTTNQGAGTTGVGGSPDQRPANTPVGYRFYARDLDAAGAPGSGTWLTKDSWGQWKTATDVVIP